MRPFGILALVALLATPQLSAANLGKFNGWNESPEAYSLTKAERDQWARIGSEADAGQFVQKYLADRGGETFSKELEKRIAMADKYLTVGPTPGSKSLRGKIVILLGPPAGMNIAVRQPRTPGRSGTADMGMMAGGESGGASAYDVASVAQREGMSGADTGLRDYQFTYGAATVGAKKDALFVVEVELKTGKDRMVDKKAVAELDKILESAAASTLTRQ